jgi:hypothetical protein
VKRKDVAARRGLKEAWNKQRADGQELDLRPTVLGERAYDREPTSIKGTGGKSSGCAWKAIELTSGDLLHVTES